MRKKMHQTGKFSFILLGLGCLCLISGGILIGRQMSATPKAESSAPEEVPYEQEKITDAEVTGEFYYEQLSDEEQTVYREILQGIQENKKEWLIIGFYLLGFLAMIYAIWGLYRQKKKRSQILNENSIRQAMDQLPCGVCFSDENGRILLCNLQMHELCQMQQVIIFSILAFS